MIRITVLLAVVLLVPRLAEAKHARAAQVLQASEAPQAPGAAKAPQAPRAPEAPRASKAPRAPQMWTFEFEAPVFPEIADIPDFDEFFDLHGLRDLDRLRDLPRLLARAGRDRDEDEDDDDDKDAPPEKDEKGVHVYRMNHDRRHFSLPHISLGGEEWSDERNASAQAKGNGSVTLPVKGPVTFQLRAQGAEVEVVSSDKQQVLVTLSDAPVEEIALYAFGDRVEPAFRGRRLLRRGKLRVELPRGSRLDVSTLSGDVTAQKLGEVRVHTLSGDVKVSGVGKAEVQSISGDVRLDDSSGPVRLHLVSGKATVLASGAAPQLEFQSTSGSLEWSGTCGRDCHLSAETVSGDVRLAVDAKSSFELSYTSHSGELRDELNLAVRRPPVRQFGMTSGWMKATFGKGEGVIEASAFSGNLVMKKK